VADTLERHQPRAGDLGGEGFAVPIWEQGIGRAVEHERRLGDAAEPRAHGFAAFELRELVREGRPFGTVPIAGRKVQVVAGVSLSALVAVDAVVRRRVTVRPGVTFPPEAGETVGFVTVSTPDMRMGRVPLVVADVPGPPPAEPGPWWRRAGSAVLEAVSSVLSALLG